MKKLTLTIILQLLLYYAFLSPSYAQLPDQGELAGSISSEVQAGIKANTNANSISQEATGQQPQVEAPNVTELTNTGDNVDVNTQTGSNENTTVNNDNNAVVNQNVDATVNTGNNTASRNISFGGDAGMIYTGDARVNVSEAAYVNNSATGISGVGSGASSSTGITNSGDDVSTSTSASGASTTVVSNGNTAIVSQNADVTANTGNNHADRNIAFGGGDAGKIISGDASINVGYMVVANGSAVLVGGDNGSGGPGSGASIYITNTGGRFSAFGRLYDRVNTVVNNSNYAYISQSCGSPVSGDSARMGQSQGMCAAITGNNTSNRNIAMGGDAGVIKTGDAEVNVSMYAKANSNSTSIENGGGGAYGNTQIDNTGNNVDVDTTSQSDVNTTVNNDNYGRIDQNVYALADTGNNEANRNIAIGGSAGIIRTGNATVNVSLTAELNNNDTQVKSGSASLAGDPSLQTSVYNTGDNVTVSTRAGRNTSILVSNNNFLVLDQNIVSETNTGNNTTDKNIATTLGCCDEEEEEIPVPQPTDSPQPTSVPAAVGGEDTGGTSGGSTAEVAAAVAEKDDDSSGSVLGASTLPFTGSRDMFILVFAGLLAIAGLKLKNTGFSTVD